MKIPRLEFNAEKFYLVGKYAFFIMGVIGLIKVVDLWSQMKSYDIFSSLASTVFQFALYLFFAHLQGKESVKEVSDEGILKMQKALDELNLGGENNGKKR